MAAVPVQKRLLELQFDELAMTHLQEFAADFMKLLSSGANKQDLSRAMEKNGVKASVPLMYDWENPTRPQHANFVQILVMLLTTRNCLAIRYLAECCGWRCMSEDEYQDIKTSLSRSMKILERD